MLSKDWAEKKGVLMYISSKVLCFSFNLCNPEVTGQLFNRLLHLVILGVGREVTTQMGFLGLEEFRVTGGLVKSQTEWFILCVCVHVCMWWGGVANGSTFSFTLPFLLLIYSTIFSLPIPNVRLYAEGIREPCLFFLKGKCFRKPEVGEERKRNHLLWIACVSTAILCKHRVLSIGSVRYFWHL